MADPLLAVALTLLCAAKDYPMIETLPDPFRFKDGSRVADRADWGRRREEICAMLLAIEYGHVPEEPGGVRVASASPLESRHGGAVRFQEVRLAMGPEGAVPMRLEVYRPAEALEPCPVILRIGLGCPILDEVTARGFAFVAFDHCALDPDTEGRDVIGPAQAAYPELDWGSLAIWAWGASRAADYVAAQPWAKADELVVTGHSRTGKAALLAGALDARFAVTVPNGSGCGGASCYRIKGKGSETLELITRKERFAAWFHRDFRRFARKETRLPFDQQGPSSGAANTM